MARPRQPIDLIVANGRKHLTKAETAQRRATEVAPCTEGIKAPSYLTSAEKKKFQRLAEQLTRINIMGETDTEALARYVTAQSLYEKATKELRDVIKDRPTDRESEGYYDRLALWCTVQTGVARLQDRYFKQAQAVAASLGLTISSRCKLVAPVKEDAPKVNKFARFVKAANVE